MGIGGIALWVMAGQNPGWTKTSKEILKIDPVTELQYPVYEKGFYPGVDFLAGTIVVGVGFMIGASFIRKKV